MRRSSACSVGCNMYYVFPLGTACTLSSWWLLCDDHNGRRSKEKYRNPVQGGAMMRKNYIESCLFLLLKIVWLIEMYFLPLLPKLTMASIASWGREEPRGNGSVLIHFPASTPNLPNHSGKRSTSGDNMVKPEILLSHCIVRPKSWHAVANFPTLGILDE